MFPSTQRSSHHPVMGQQSGYIGYYPGAQHPSQYQPSDLNYNFQPMMSHMSEGFSNGAWSNPHPMYMSSAHPLPTPAGYQQRSGGYDDWGIVTSAIHQVSSSSGASSPGVMPPTSPSSNNSASQSSVRNAQPPLTPSPCALSNGDTEASTYYSNYCNSKVSSEFSEHDVTHTSAVDSGDIPEPDITIEPKSPVGPIGRQTSSPYQWLKKSLSTQNGNTEETFVEMDSTSKGKTRTKDKYRVVYNDHQRMELEKEFLYSRYITINRKSQLATILGLSERQVKIWFQNRRAKERKQTKKRHELTIDEKEKMETGISFLPGSSFHQVTHHHPSHGGGHPHAIHHSFHHIPQHHKHASLMMDMKPPSISIEMKPVDYKSFDMKMPALMDMKPSIATDMRAPHAMDMKMPIAMDMKPPITMDLKPPLSSMN